MAKRKRQSLSNGVTADESVGPPPTKIPTLPTRKSSSRATIQPKPAIIDANPDTNPTIKDGQEALRASPDAEGAGEKFKIEKAVKKPVATPKKKALHKQSDDESDSPLSDLSDLDEAVKAPPKPSNGRISKPSKSKDEMEDRGDPEADDEEAADPEELREAMSRPPPVNSSYLPLPWKGRIGYACLNTYLRAATPPVFSSRTCRIASILEHRHPLKDPSQPEHATKNRPDKDQPADVARGQAYVEALGVANAKDIPKMLRWNDRYGIKFFRLSSEMFPFASHDIYGYRLAPFAAEALADAGRVAAELGHRLTTHPGQFTQLGSPRKEVVTASLRDLEYHCELLDLLKLPEQQNRDAVMILHMGGIFGDKQATLARFRENYVQLPQKIKNRLVLENDDVCYSVHDLLPICEELNIPMVLDYHHNNIVFDAEQIREGTLDIMEFYPRILATWKRKNITPKMHYSEPTPAAITARQRRKHSPRVATLPPCPPDMDLMIEAKDKEQAVLELMRIFKLPKFDSFNDIVPHVRSDENKAWKPPKKKTPKKKKGAEIDMETPEEPEHQPPPVVPDDEVAMGGPEGRVYWPPGMEEWLRPKKREVKPRDVEKAKTTAEKAAQRRAEKAAWQAAREASAEVGGTDGSIKIERDASASLSASEMSNALPSVDIEKTKSVYDKSKTSNVKPARAPKSNGTPANKKTKKSVKSVPTPVTSESEDDLDDDDSQVNGTKDVKLVQSRPLPARKPSARGAKKRAVNYADGDDED